MTRTRHGIWIARPRQFTLEYQRHINCPHFLNKSLTTNHDRRKIRALNSTYQLQATRYRQPMNHYWSNAQNNQAQTRSLRDGTRVPVVADVESLSMEFMKHYCIAHDPGGSDG